MSKANSLVQAIKERGIRITPQRAIIIEAIEALPGHVTADEIFDKVQGVNAFISLATVYRTLDLLKNLGLVTESHMGRSSAHYALHSHGAHHHAVCRICDASIELPHNVFSPIAQTLRDEFDFMVDDKHVVVLGWCKACFETLEGVKGIPEK